ncbi:MAG TPA: aspartate kinase [Saprospiraceae bacterium]|nr:aspartate kinase [Saprospiraceae bacterium]
MQVLKFGGTSVGSPERMHHVADLIQREPGQKIIVLSAVSGTTNKLVAIAAALANKNQEEARTRLQELEQEYAAFIEELLPAAQLGVAEKILGEVFAAIRDQMSQGYGPDSEKVILAQGELISTQLFQLYLKSTDVDAVLLPALAFMRTQANGEPDLAYIRQHIDELLDTYESNQLFITQGYICRNAEGAIDNLQRGGSDYTATLIGAAVQADEIQIWTDIDGLHNNDPRVVKETHPVRRVSYREAAELAYFGAKILHPTCVIPAETENVPIRLKSTFLPEATGTLISEQASGQNLTAIAAKDGICALKIRSGRMLNAYGFLRKVFEVFESYRTPIDMITTSEVSVSLTIDDRSRLPQILAELRAFGEVSVDEDHSIICIVGDALNEQRGSTKKIFTALEDIPIRMVSYGGSNNNISVLIATAYKQRALQCLHQELFAPVLVGA